MPTINIDLNWPDHPKTKRLIRAAGVDAPFRLVALWCYAGKYHPNDGDLSSYTIDDIEGIVGWTGERGVFYNAMISSRYLDEDLTLHGWTEHEGHLEAYREKARIMNEARLSKTSSRHHNDTPKKTTTTQPELPSSVQGSSVQGSNKKEEKPGKPGDSEAVQFWMSTYQDKIGEEYKFFPKDGVSIARIVKAVGDDKFKEMALWLITTTEKWHCDKRTPQHLLNQINEIGALMKKQTSQSGGVPATPGKYAHLGLEKQE